MAEITTRPVTVADAPALAALLTANRSHLAPWDPIRPDEYFTAAGQADLIDAGLRTTSILHVILVDGEIAGRINLNNVVRGPFRSGNLGYWVDHARTGRGVATAAVRAFTRVVFDEQGLHRMEAGTLVHNHASQRVLTRTGFTPFGLAPRYLRIAGQWQDHRMFQLLAEDR
ncbi:MULTISPECIES: GNAT family N-acetyltransferase [Catenuloplanes]|uniref:Ribosomal-protein-alanine N-acetyltransferase n=1 Tax=Catenuloplanes niger TaxID=587534 RepID=A0AAE4CW44_9ACTN|nr:GNAT family protein [Catenuloplanes niger]MDR7326112.1 ribosomal-protein-alanine N-acetyltransferase [Catenuloplanes niger]